MNLAESGDIRYCRSSLKAEAWRLLVNSTRTQSCEMRSLPVFQCHLFPLFARRNAIAFSACENWEPVTQLCSELVKMMMVLLSIGRDTNELFTQLERTPRQRLFN